MSRHAVPLLIALSVSCLCSSLILRSCTACSVTVSAPRPTPYPVWIAIAFGLSASARGNVTCKIPFLYSAEVLSGSTALDVLAAGMAESPEPAGLEAFNAGFEHRTGFEWLSRDEAEVDAYVADPWCGFETPPETIPMLFAPGARLADASVLAGIRSDLPVLITSGSDDPLAGGGQLVELLGARYREAGLADVTVTVYPGARHEILNETNRDEVTADIVGWLTAHLPS